MFVINIMFRSLASIVLASAAFVSPVVAGIHDFNPTNVGPTRRAASTTAGIKGNCFTTQDRSRYCFFTEDGVNYNVAIYDVDYPAHPLAVTINCSTGRWKAYGNMPKSHMTLWGNVLCKNFS